MGFRPGAHGEHRERRATRLLQPVSEFSAALLSAYVGRVVIPMYLYSAHALVFKNHLSMNLHISVTVSLM